MYTTVQYSTVQYQEETGGREQLENYREERERLPDREVFLSVSCQLRVYRHSIDYRLSELR